MNFYYLTLILVLLSLLVLYALERSRIGLTWFSVRESESLSESVGINTTSSKVLAFCIGSFFAGLAGALYSQYNSVITPSAFGFVYSMYVLIYMIVGGAQSFCGRYSRRRHSHVLAGIGPGVEGIPTVHFRGGGHFGDVFSARGSCQSAPANHGAQEGTVEPCFESMGSQSISAGCRP